ncbi:transmembrane signal receptor [Lithospermum erythrorhizon]|uniref:Transmembrane signal receptor n=1 Tax=Lithospermum erythrorhizon TaxID=34254 RepID=A0AAV3P679_LITER
MVQDTEPDDPVMYKEVAKHEKWRTAIQNEINSIEKNNTWTLIELPKDGKTIGVKWIFKTKRNENGEIIKHKARLVAKGYSQEEGIDYTEVFAPVARMDTVRMIISLAAQKDWKLYQLDVKSPFLHGELNEEVYVDQPEGYVKKGKEHMVYRLHKALYGLKQAPRAWFNKIESHFVFEGFKRCASEQTLFTKKNSEGKILIVSIYVDDLIFTGDDHEQMKTFKESMMKKFDMTDLGLLNYFLGIEVVQKADGLFICQRRYAEGILKKFETDDCNHVNSPILPGIKVGRNEEGKPVDETHFKQIVGSLMYLTSTRPDLMFATSLINRYMSNPTELHLQVAKKILRYLKGTTQYGILYQKGSNGRELEAYTDSDYAGDINDRKSTSGYVFKFSSGAVAWTSKKQPIVSLSTTEAEFIAAVVCTCQAIWMKRIFKELGYKGTECINIKCDNSSTIKLSKNPVMHGRSKHIDVRYHFLRDLTKEGAIELVHCGSSLQVADIMTKPLKIDSFLKLRSMMGMCEFVEVS